MASTHATPTDERPHLFDQTPDTLAELVVQWGMPRFRAKQIIEWVYDKGGR